MRQPSNAPLQTKLWKAIFLPVFIVISATSALLYLSEIFDRNDQFEYLAHYQTQQAADSSEYALLFNDRNLISNNIHSLLRQLDVVGVTYYNSQGKVIDSIGQPSPSPEGLPDKIQSYYLNSDDLYQTVAPVYYINTSATSAQNSPFSDPNATIIADAIGLTQTPQQELLGWVQVTSSTQRIQLESMVIALATVAFFCIANLLAAVLCWRYANVISQPFINLTRSLSLITSGEYDKVNQHALPDMLHSTQKDIDYITERLKNYRTELDTEIEQITKETRENADLLEEKSAQLHIANKEAMESNRLKTQFLANISHEVRTPLNAILGYTNLLQKDKLGIQQKSYVDTIEQSTNDLLTTIGNILDFSKIEAGKTVVLDNEDFNIKEVIDDVLHSLASTPSIEQKEVDLVPQFSTDLPDWVKGDKTRLRQILNNLVGNAIKFTQTGSIRIVADCNVTSDDALEISIEVIDTGCGIPHEKLSQLFKPFSQVDSSHTRSYAGTGLGLVITKKLIEQMGGNIGVNSEVNRGSNFYFSIKLERSNKAAEILSPIEQHFIVLETNNNYREYLSSCLNSFAASYEFSSSLEQFMATLHNTHYQYTAAIICVNNSRQAANEANELQHYLEQRFSIPTLLLCKPNSHLALNAQQYKIAPKLLQKPISAKKLHLALNKLIDPKTEIEQPAKAPEGAQDQYEDLQELHILAVDDTPINLQLLGHWLEPYNIRLSLAYSGQQAIDMSLEQQFDLILMDIQMPQMDGMQTTQHLRQIEEYKDIPIIALTAHALAQEQQSILASGMNAYLTKPISESTLLNTLRDWCTSQKSLSSQVEEELSEVFDLDKALSMAGNRVQAAKDLFDMLMTSLSDDKRLLTHHFENEDLEKLIATVHRIHGASKYSGTIELTKHANFLETHLKELGFDEVEEVFDDFMKSLERLENAQTLIPWPQVSQTPEQTAVHQTS